MANIIIQELDNSAFLNRRITNENFVVVAGSCIQSAPGVVGEFVTCRSLKEFYSNFGSSPLEGDELGWEYAANLIRRGFPVMYYLYWKPGDTNSQPMTDEDKLSRLLTEDNIEILMDKNQAQIKFIPSIYTPSASQVTLLQQIVDDAIGGRGDSIAFIDYIEGNVNSSTAAQDDSKYISDLASGVTGSSYLVVASPAGVLSSPITGKMITMPPSFWVLKTMAEGVSRGLPIWSTWAGAKRGAISDLQAYYSGPYQCKDSLEELAAEGKVSGRNVTVTMQQMKRFTEIESIIPLMYINPYGNLVFGNSTRLNVGESGSPEAPTTRSALDSFNVRLVANEIKRAIYQICLGLVFDSNNIVLWNTFKENLAPILDGMASGGGLNEYLILMDETTVTGDDIDQLTVPGIVRVDITRAAEIFDITFELTPTGAVFEDI